MGEAGRAVRARPKPPSATGPPPVDDEARKFWAFRPVIRPAVPEIRDPQFEVRNPIDAFVLAKLQAAELHPAPPADKATLLRRVYYAVTGLPPTPAEVDAFLADNSPDAYEKVVDRLLDSRHYGEQWGRHWLDVVRFAESNSFERDGTKPFAWRYRDYVIKSFNADKPYDRFIKEQLAGDEMDPVNAGDADRHRLLPARPLGRRAGRRRRLAYFDGLDDIVSTTGQAFLGLTVGCARCHDHKIDPFPQTDYYRLLAFFRGVRHYGVRSARIGGRGIGGPDRRASPDMAEAAAAHQKKVAEVESRIGLIEAGVYSKLVRRRARRLRARDEQAADHAQARRRRRSRRSSSTNTSELRTGTGSCLRRNAPKSPGPGAGGQGKRPEAARTRSCWSAATPTRPGRKSSRAFPTVLTTATARPATPREKSSGRRTVLADWIADPANPLTARVMVNRVWQYHFGRGIVRSASNFGYQGTPPTHPELLDWLASEFVAHGWSLKHTPAADPDVEHLPHVRARFDPAAAAKDPENDLLWRFDPRRLTAEEIRDSILAVSGNLNLKKADGPSVYPVIPKEVLAGQSRPGDGWGRSVAGGGGRPQRVRIREAVAGRADAGRLRRPGPGCAVPGAVHDHAADAGARHDQQRIRQSAGQGVRRVGGEGNRQTRRRQVRLALRRVTQRAPTEAEVDRGVRFAAAKRGQAVGRRSAAAVLPAGAELERVRICGLKTISRKAAKDAKNE